MSVLMVRKDDFFFGIPSEQKKFTPPDGCLKWRIRLRKDDWPKAYIKFPDRTVERIILDKGDHWEASEEHEQAVNRKP